MKLISPKKALVVLCLFSGLAGSAAAGSVVTVPDETRAGEGYSTAKLNVSDRWVYSFFESENSRSLFPERVNTPARSGTATVRLAFDAALAGEISAASHAGKFSGDVSLGQDSPSVSGLSLKGISETGILFLVGFGLIALSTIGSPAGMARRRTGGAAESRVYCLTPQIY
jgi:hypothetical protein